MTSFNLEPKGEKEKRTIEKYVALQSGRRSQRNMTRLWTMGESSSGAGIMLAAYAPGGATKALIDLLLNQLSESGPMRIRSRDH